MKIIQLSEVGVGAAARSAAAVLRAGGVILYPTDTLYGLGADALSDNSVAKVKKIKGRDDKKPIHAIVADVEMIGEFAVMNESAHLLARKFWPGPLTLVLKSIQGRSALGGETYRVKKGILRDIETFGVRVPKNDFCQALSREFGKPYTTTSANKSGKSSERSVENILAQLGELASEISLVIDAGELPERSPSTVVDVRAESPEILREGAITSAEILDIVRA